MATIGRRGGDRLFLWKRALISQKKTRFHSLPLSLHLHVQHTPDRSHNRDVLMAGLSLGNVPRIRPKQRDGKKIVTRSSLCAAFLIAVQTPCLTH